MAGEAYGARLGGCEVGGFVIHVQYPFGESARRDLGGR
jgi:hypothetical protein